MNRTRWLEETKQMRFEEAYNGWKEKRLTQEEAAQLLGVCARSFRRYIDRYHVATLLLPGKLLLGNISSLSERDVIHYFSQALNMRE